jgi:hypothetical protein
MLHFQQKEPCPGWKFFTRKENRKRVIVLDNQLLLIHYYSEDDNGRKKTCHPGALNIFFLQHIRMKNKCYVTNMINTNFIGSSTVLKDFLYFSF